MLEIPEAVVLAKQLNQTIRGLRIAGVIAAAAPHKFAWFSGEPKDYAGLLTGKVIGGAAAYGGRVEIQAGDMLLHFGDGVNLRIYNRGEPLPAKHQLLIELDSGAALVATVAMYGGIWCFRPGGFDDNPYYRAAKESLSPLSDAFDYGFFIKLLDEQGLKLSAKAFLATEQRIPGLGNGVLQDILLNAKIHPKTKMHTLTDTQRHELFGSIKRTLGDMAAAGGRDTERDLFGNPGGYALKLSKNTLWLPCRNCGGHICRQSYMGGSIYYCQSCQPL